MMLVLATHGGHLPHGVVCVKGCANLTRLKDSFTS